MKKLLLLCCMAATLSYGQTPLYLNFISHSEVSDTFDYEMSSADYWLVTDIARKIADTVIDRQARWDVMVDANYVRGTLMQDAGYTNTDDFLEYANNSPYLDVDPHNHFDTTDGMFSANYNPYNYPDVVHLLDSCGITLTENIVGGFNWLTPDDDWTPFQTLVDGNMFPGFSWQADILWGAGSTGHSNDVDDFGIWKPTGPTPITFFQHSLTNHLTYIGGGCKDNIHFIIRASDGVLDNTADEIISNILYLSDYINGLSSSANDYYTANVLLNFRDMPVIPAYVDSVTKIIDGLQAYVDAGKIVWATLAEKYEGWNAAHSSASDYFIYYCDDTPLWLPALGDSPFQVRLYPNPATGNSVRLELEGALSEKPEWLSVSDMLGNVIRIVDLSNADDQLDLNIGGLSSGIYSVSIISTSGRKLSKQLLISR